jgi:hypothetical protein
MGLDTTHNCWHGSYGGFSYWRNLIAEAAGYKLVRSGGVYDHVTIDLDWDQYEAENFYGKWAKDPEDILLVLIVHSDCEGEIKKRHLLPLADRLEEVLKDLPEDETFRDIHGTTQQFIDGLRLAAEMGQKVKFH